MDRIVFSYDEAKNEDLNAYTLARIRDTGEALVLVSIDFSKSVSALRAFAETISSCCPNKRVKHLALFSKKKRTKKKNNHRVMKEIEKNEKNHHR